LLRSTVAVGDELSGVLNPLGINAIRALSGRGLRILGARTVSSDPDWRFISVRRLLILIEKSILVSSQWCVFEPNDAFTRAKLQMSLNGLLLSLWEQGGLVGNTPQEAFRIQCDEDNNPPSQREQGRLWAEVGVAPSQPLEFILLRVGRANNEVEISNPDGRMAAHMG